MSSINTCEGRYYYYVEGPNYRVVKPNGVVIMYTDREFWEYGRAAIVALARGVKQRKFDPGEDFDF